jgi:hypothetical protein
MGEAKRATYEGQDVFACFTGASLSQSRRSAPSTVGLNFGLCMVDLGCIGLALVRPLSYHHVSHRPMTGLRQDTATGQRQDSDKTATAR